MRRYVRALASPLSRRQARYHLAVRYRVYRPRSPLSACVDYFWSMSEAPPHASERVVPSGAMELVFNLTDHELRIAGSVRRIPGAIVSGCYSSPFPVDTRLHAAMVGVHFKPGGAAGLFGVAPGELANTHVDLEVLWGRQALELRERLHAAANVHERFLILEHALSSWLARARDPRGAVKHALTELDRPRIDIGRVSRELSLSRRRFIEIFTEDVGMTPKRYARVRRFQRALAAAMASSPPRWAELALACGYFDQAHLCREWAKLTGVSPSEFVALRRKRVKDNRR